MLELLRKIIQGKSFEIWTLQLIKADDSILQRLTLINYLILQIYIYKGRRILSNKRLVVSEQVVITFSR